MPSMKSLLREPLLHFLVLGLALFLLDALWSAQGSSEQRIVMSPPRITALVENFKRTWQRLPTGGELDGLIEEQVRDEILTREALRLGLDRDDTIIRRRLRQKLEIITEESSDAATPSDAELESYRKAHAELFRSAPQIAFEQVFFDPSKHGARLGTDIAQARAALEKAAAHPEAAQAQGDALFVLQASYPPTDQRAIASSFGDAFAAALAQLGPDAVGHWLGPIESGYGQHLVRLQTFEASREPALAEIRALVEREWRNVQRNQAREAQYQALRANYRIEIAGKSSAP